MIVKISNATLDIAVFENFLTRVVTTKLLQTLRRQPWPQKMSGRLLEDEKPALEWDMKAFHWSTCAPVGKSQIVNHFLSMA